MSASDSTRHKPYGVIYMVTHIASGKRYIGQTVGCVKKRWKGHLKNNNGCRRLKNAIAKYGADAFEITVIFEAASAEELNQKEVEFISFYGTQDESKGYNLLPGGGSGKQHAETIERRAKALRGKQLSEEHRRKLSESHKGYVPTEEARANLSASLTGIKRPRTPEHAAKLAAARRGQKLPGPMPEEWRAKIGAANAGKVHGPMSEERKQKLSEAQKGKAKNFSPEGRERTLEAARKHWEQFRLEGRSLPDEARAVRSQNSKAMWADPAKKAKIAEASGAGNKAAWADPEKKAARIAKYAETRARNRAAAEAAGNKEMGRSDGAAASWADPEKKAARLAKCAETRARKKAAKEAAKAATEAAKAETETVEA
jgi:group I intron endonuclease